MSSTATNSSAACTTRRRRASSTRRPGVQAYFENLLPEGELRAYIAQQNQASTLFSMLLAVAGDTAGAFLIFRKARSRRRPCMAFRPNTAARRHAGPAGAIRPVPARRHAVRPQVREGGRPRLARDFALSVGREFRPGHIARSHVDAVAGQLRMRPAFVLRQAAEMAEKIPEALDAALQAIVPVVPPGGKDLATKLRAFVLSTTRKTAARLAGPS